MNGKIPNGAIQIHHPGDAASFVARDSFELIRFVVPQPVFDSVVGWLGHRQLQSPINLVDRVVVVDRFLLAAGHELRSALHADSASSRVHMESLTTSVLTHLLTRHSNLTSSESAAQRDSRLRRAFELIDDRAGSNVSISELCAVTGLSSPTLVRRFKLITGLSPQRWMLQRRVEHGARLLLETGQSCTDIATDCGFASAQHFSFAFKKSRGVTPTEFRLRGHQYQD